MHLDILRCVILNADYKISCHTLHCKIDLQCVKVHVPTMYKCILIITDR